MKKLAIAMSIAIASAFSALAAGFDGMDLVTNSWFAADFTADLATGSAIVANSSTGVTYGAGTWTTVPATGTAVIAADADAGGGKTMLSLEAPGEELTFTPSPYASPSGMETFVSELKADALDSDLPALGPDVQSAFTLFDDGEGNVSAMAWTVSGWTNFTYAASGLTNAWFTLYSDFATVGGVRYVRYSVKPASGSLAILTDASGTAWFQSPVNASSVTSVSLSGTADVRKFSGDELTRVPVATYNGQEFPTVADAIAAAEEGGTVTLVKTAYNELISITKNVSIDLNSNPLNCDSFNISEGTTLTVVNTGNKQIKAPAFTGGGSIVSSNGLRLCPTNATTTSNLASIDVTGDLSFDTGSTGTFNVSGDVTATGSITVRDMTLNVTGTIEGSAIIASGSVIPGGYNSATVAETVITANKVIGEVSGNGTVVSSDALAFSSNSDSTFIGTLGANGVTKTGGGTLTIAGTNAFSGTLTISGGTVALANPYSLGTLIYDFDATYADNVATTNAIVDDVETDTKLFYRWVAAQGTASNPYLYYNRDPNNNIELMTDENVFGGKQVLHGSTIQLYDNSWARGWATTFIMWKRANTTGNYTELVGSWSSGSATTSDSKYYIRRRGSSYNYYSWHRGIGGSYTAGLWSNGVAGAPITADHQLMTICGFWGQSDNRPARFLGATDAYVAEILSFSSKFTMAARRTMEAYLMAKWGVGGVEYTPLTKTAAVALASGTTLDLGGLSQTVQSLSGSGTVQNGTLTVTDAISVEVGDTLVIPYGSTYTLANDGTYAAVDSVGGTVTITHRAADIDGTPYDTVAGAIAAYTSGTLTIHEDATLDLGTTEVNISGIVLDEGVELTLTQNAPWQTTFSDGNLVNARTASTYVWTPGESSADWAALSNWRISSATPVALPGASDTVSFASSGTVTLSANVEVGTLSIADAIRVQFTAESLKNLVVGDYICGSGTTNALSNIKLVPQEKDVAYTLDVGGIVEIVDGTSNQIRATSHRVGEKNKPAMTLTISGNLIGGGNVEFGSNSGQSRAYVNLSGDNSGFMGVATINGNNTGSFRWMSADSGSASARWVTINGPTMNFGFTSGTLKLGSFETSTGVSLASNSTPSLEIGGYGNDSELGSNFSRGSSSRSLNLVKVGSGKLVFSGTIANGNGQGNITIGNGTLDIAASQSLPNAGAALTMTGGILAVSGTTTDAEENTVFVDPSAYIKNCTTYPITFSNAVDEVHTWSTALASSNTGGLVKKGEGTLTLAAVPRYTGDTYLDGGKLRILKSVNITVKTHDEVKVVRKRYVTSGDKEYIEYRLGDKPATLIYF